MEDKVGPPILPLPDLLEDRGGLELPLLGYSARELVHPAFHRVDLLLDLLDLHLLLPDLLLDPGDPPVQLLYTLIELGGIGSARRTPPVHAAGILARLGQDLEGLI